MASILVISDVHSNLEALRAVFAHARDTYPRPDEIWCLGDLVGYGVDPNACIELLRDPQAYYRGGMTVRCVRGNHDAEVARARDVAAENETDLQKNWRWTEQQLKEENRRFLSELPLSLTLDHLSMPALLVHAAPPDDINRYLYTASQFEEAQRQLQQRLCLFGHTHLPCYVEVDRVELLSRSVARPRLFPQTGETVTVQADAMFFNPGTVGQPRWGMPRNGTLEGSPGATYLWLEVETTRVRATLHRVSYDHQETIRKMKRADVPQRYIDRIVQGRI